MRIIEVFVGKYCEINKFYFSKKKKKIINPKYFRFILPQSNNKFKIYYLTK